MSENASDGGSVAVGGGTVADKVPLVEVRDVAKYFGSVNALQGISLKVYPGEVTCVLGDNGAGKSTLIKILSGVFQPDAGEFLIAGEPVTLAGPREARAAGIATVFQDLATVPLMSLWRNFFLGQEPVVGWGPLRRIDTARARAIMRDELAKMGIDVRDPNQNVGTLSGGERQALAIARAVYFGARVLILDEPTSALGVRQSGVVLKYIVQARELGKGVIFITHNPHHAYPVGDRFYLLKRGQLMASVLKSETTIKGLTDMMAGGQELEELSRELMGLTGSPDVPDAELASVARVLAEEAPSEPAELSGGRVCRVIRRPSLPSYPAAEPAELPGGRACRVIPRPRGRGVLVEAGLRALVPEHRLKRAVEEVPARAPDLHALQRPVGGPHRVPVLHRGREPAPRGAGPVQVGRAVEKHDTCIHRKPPFPFDCGLCAPLQIRGAGRRP
jgi:simple sugar transport system ATP-binding protein